MRARDRFRAGLLALLLPLGGAGAAVLCPSPVQAADTNKILHNALKYYEKGDYEKAMKEFNRVLALEPNHAMAREYVMLCSQKIVVKKVGQDNAQTIEKEVAVEKQIQQMKAAEPPPPPKKDLYDYEDTASTVPAGGDVDLSALGIMPQNPSEARDILEQQAAVAEELRRRHLGLDNVVQLDESHSVIQVTLFMNRLFLPFSDVMRDEGIAVLDHVITQIRNNKKRKVVLKAVDASSPAAQKALPDLASRRCTVVFSYLVYATYRPDDQNVLASFK